MNKKNKAFSGGYRHCSITHEKGSVCPWGELDLGGTCPGGANVRTPRWSDGEHVIAARVAVGGSAHTHTHFTLHRYCITDGVDRRVRLPVAVKD